MSRSGARTVERLAACLVHLGFRVQGWLLDTTYHAYRLQIESPRGLGLFYLLPLTDVEQAINRHDDLWPEVLAQQIARELLADDPAARDAVPQHLRAVISQLDSDNERLQARVAELEQALATAEATIVALRGEAPKRLRVKRR